MDVKKYTTPDELEKWSFLWSEVRLVIAAIALFLGGYPPALKMFMGTPFSNIASSLLTICWLISGVAAVYLGYRYHNCKKEVFGGKDPKDLVAFFIMVITGLNLGIAGLLSINIGMRISSNSLVFAIVGFIYLGAAGYLFYRWKENGKKLF